MLARAGLACAVLALTPLALAGCTGDDGAPPAETATSATPTVPATPAPSRRPLAADARRVRRELAGIPQTRLLLGSAQAPVTVVEYSDPTCAPCAATQRGLVRALVERYVGPGVASLELRPLANDARARGLARSIFAASLQRRGWDMLQLAALRSPEGSGTRPRSASTSLDGDATGRSRAGSASSSRTRTSRPWPASPSCRCSSSAAATRPTRRSRS